MVVVARKIVDESFGWEKVTDTVVQEIELDPNRRQKNSLVKSPMRTFDEALDAAIRSNIRLDPRREIVTPASLGLSPEEAREYGSQFVTFLLARESNKSHEDYMDQIWWDHLGEPCRRGAVCN